MIDRAKWEKMIPDIKVVIILPVSNSVKYIQDAVDSILNHTTYPHWRMIIVESASIDGTKEYCQYLAKKFPDKISVIHQDKRYGLTNAINTGIKATTEEEDVYLTQDDVILPNLYGKRDWLTEFVKISMEHNQIGLVTSANGGGTSGPEYLNGMKWIGTWSLYIPRRTINKVGLFDEKFHPGPGDDIDYTYRVITLNNMVGVQTLFGVDHHRETEHINNDSKDRLKNAKYFREKHKIGEENK